MSSNNFENSDSVILKRVRLDYHSVFKAEPNPQHKDNRDKDRFKVRALFEKDSEAYKAGVAGLMQAATRMWGANAKQVLSTMQANSKAIRNGDANLDDKGNVKPNYAGLFYIQANNKNAPQVVAQARHNGKFVNIGEDGRGYVDGRAVDDLPFTITKPYRGCYVDLKVTFTAAKQMKMNNGEVMPNQVYAQLEAVKFVADGEAFGRGATSAEGFEDEEITESATDEMDDISF